MILTNCAACAAPLAHDAPTRCARCRTRYCSATCLNNHAHRGDHDDEKCAEIERGGGAEQYHADRRYKEAVAVAVEKCAEDTAGQTCYICLDGGAEGLVRGCSCRGENGFVHMSCLVRAAEVTSQGQTGWARWSTCRLCEQNYHGVVACALGWACWKTYLGRSEDDRFRRTAISVLGNGLSEADHDEDALSVREAELSMRRRLGDPLHNILTVQGNLANSYAALERFEEALSMERDVYRGSLTLLGEEHASTLIAAINYTASLNQLRRCEEAKPLLRKTMPVARRVLGEGHDITLRMVANYATALLFDDDATLDDLREAVTTLEEIEPIARRVFGGAHPMTRGIEENLQVVRDALRAREEPSDDEEDA